MKSLSSNREFYDYLVHLSEDLKALDLKELSETVVLASRTAAGMSTEFLGESRIALRRVMNEENGRLPAHARTDLQDVLRQLDEALDRK